MVTRAVGAPRRSSSAFVATVMPCAKAPSAPGSRPDASTAATTPRDWSSGVDGTLATTTPSGPTAARSVNVPPTSTPSRYPAIDGGW